MRKGGLGASFAVHSLDDSELCTVAIQSHLVSSIPLSYKEPVREQLDSRTLVSRFSSPTPNESLLCRSATPLDSGHVAHDQPPNPYSSSPSVSNVFFFTLCFIFPTAVHDTSNGSEPIPPAVPATQRSHLGRGLRGPAGASTLDSYLSK